VPDPNNFSIIGMFRTERLLRALIAFIIGILIAASLNYLYPLVDDARKEVLRSIRAVIERK
jgi:ABC-type antimicrobial peptide transport system permease subunit